MAGSVSGSGVGADGAAAPAAFGADGAEAAAGAGVRAGALAAGAAAAGGLAGGLLAARRRGLAGSDLRLLRTRLLLRSGEAGGASAVPT